MALNGISTLPTKELRQVAKLNLAQSKRQAGGDTSLPYYREYNVYDITLLPSRYIGNSVVDNPGALVQTRPWTVGVIDDGYFLTYVTGEYVETANNEYFEIYSN